MVWLASLATLASAASSIANAASDPPEQPSFPSPPSPPDVNQSGRLALQRERLRRGRRSTILTGASALLDADVGTPSKPETLGGP